MAKIKNRSSLKRILLGILNKAHDKLSNSNNADITTNGERRFIKEYIDSLKKTDTPYTFFDIGANKGEYTSLLIELMRSKHSEYLVHMFEPVENSYENILKNIQDKKHFVLNKVGVSDRADVLNIYYNKSGSPLASLYQRDIKEYNISLNQHEKINLIRLDTYIQERNIVHIHLLKIDVEGHEIAAFNGLGDFLNAEFIDVIQFEYGGANIDSRTYLKDFFMLLETRGFQLFKIQKNSLEPSSYRAIMENFKHSNFIAISKRMV
ncbi:FkbM family methyltransferase [uncultured Cytophaga sp.]|uniref:FkbM family methyltransferase n=1 Tax=uncultured Cytophaga sp. TaxID=160238 RepID=UPI00263164D3|nr:FkbM family methyltransferase [uncultured Cytophaga sp.]